MTDFAPTQPMILAHAAPITYVDAPDGGPPMAGLSPEMLLAFMQRQLEDLDSQIGDLMGLMQDRRARLKELNAEMVELRAIKAGAESFEDDTIADDGGSIAGTRRRLDALDDVEVGGRLADGLSANEVQEMIEELDAKIGAINDESEYDAMRLQSLMSKRTQTVQMTSNMMRELDESAMSIIKNI